MGKYIGFRMWDNGVVFPFHESYPISFVNEFNFINYITIWKDNLHIIQCAKNIQKENTNWNDVFKKDLWPTN